MASTDERCWRCGTKIRNSRAACPSCGLDLKTPRAAPSVPAPQPAPSAEAGKENHAAKRPPGGRAICVVCMESFPDEQMVDLQGQRMCPTCAESMRNKPAYRENPSQK